MPMVKKIALQEGVIGLWEKAETEENFSLLIRQLKRDPVFRRITNPRRKQEFLATRALLAELVNQPAVIRYNSDGKPYLSPGGQHISISHSKNLVAVILHKNRAGIDVETTGRPISEISKKFLSGEELAFISNSGQKEKILLLCWCAKEAIYKLAGMPGLKFTGQIIIEPFDVQEEGSFAARYFAGGGERLIHLNYFFFKNNAVTWCVE